MGSGSQKNFKGKGSTGGFHKNPQNINRKGRPRKIYTILKEKGFSNDDVKGAFAELGWYTLDELKEVHTDESKPILIRIVANQFYQALFKDDYGKVREIMEHVIGKPLQSVESTTTVYEAEADIDYDKLSDSAKEEIMKASGLEYDE